MKGIRKMKVLVISGTEGVSEDSVELGINFVHELQGGPDEIEVLGLIKDDPMEKLLFASPILTGVVDTTAVYDQDLEHVASTYNWDALINFTTEEEDVQMEQLAQDNDMAYFEISEE